jgi:hypothetical protein
MSDHALATRLLRRFTPRNDIFFKNKKAAELFPNPAAFILNAKF